MAWTYSSGVLTSTGATEASPDSILAGIAVVQAADATRGYRNGFVAWMNNVQVIYVNSFIILDDDSTVEMRGTSYFASGAQVGFIFGNRSTLILATSGTPSVGTTTSNVGFTTGSTIISRRQNPNDPSPKIIYRNTGRHDFPSVPNNTQVLAKVAIAGLDLYDVNLSVPNFFRLFVANATTSTVRSIRSFVTSTGGVTFPNGNNLLLRSGIYEDLYQERVSVGTELNDSSTTQLLRPVFYSATSQALSGLIRDGVFVLTNPSFLNNCWNGSVFFQYNNLDPAAGGVPGVSSKLTIQYTAQQTFLQSLVPLSGMRVRYTRARQSVTGAAQWSAPNTLVTATTDSSGTFAAVSLIDAYREGAVNTDLERFNWTCKARRYDRKTPGETVYSNRVLYKQGTNQSLGYNEEVQVLGVSYLTLSEAQAAALTGITLTASGASSGTLTISSNRTSAEVWHFYRQWISQIANFDSNDTWNLEATTLDVGAWNVVVNSGVTLTGSVNTTGTITSAGIITGTYGDASGARISIRSTDELALTTRVTINGVDQGFIVGAQSREVIVTPQSTVRIYAHAYGYQPKIINITGNNSADYIITLIPDTNVDTTQNTTTRDLIASMFAMGTDGSRVFISISGSMSSYTAPQVLNALHYFIVSQGSILASAYLEQDSVSGLSLISRGIEISSDKFYLKAADSITNVSDAGVIMPLVIRVTDSVYTIMPTYTPVLKNPNNVLLQYAPWTQIQVDIPSWIAKESTVVKAVSNSLLAVSLRV